jgi:hypothetical protein
VKRQPLPPRTGQKPKSEKRLIASRQNGSYGGQERAVRYDHVIRSEWASRGGKAVLAKYGREYFKELRKRRTHYFKYSESPLIPPDRRVVAGKRNGSRGGMARAEAYPFEHLRKWGRLGGIATRNRYGNEFYREIRKKRKHHLKHYVTQKTKQKRLQMMVDLYKANSIRLRAGQYGFTSSPRTASSEQGRMLKSARFFTADRHTCSPHK